MVHDVRNFAREAKAAKTAEKKAAADKKAAEKQAKQAKQEALSKRKKALGLGFFATEADCVKAEKAAGELAEINVRREIL